MGTRDDDGALLLLLLLLVLLLLLLVLMLLLLLLPLRSASARDVRVRRSILSFGRKNRRKKETERATIFFVCSSFFFLSPSTKLFSTLFFSCFSETPLFFSSVPRAGKTRDS